MSAALLLRGVSYAAPGQFRPWGVDWRLGLASQRQHLLAPLEARHGPVDVFVETYPQPHFGALLADWRPRAYNFWGSPNRVSQKEMFLSGLESVLDSPDYDVVVVSRFDLEFLASPLTGCYDPDKVNFLWREWAEEHWMRHQWTGDALFVLPGHLLSDFRACVAAQEKDDTLHWLWPLVTEKLGPDQCGMLFEGYHNSNDQTPPGNPLYRLLRVQ